MTPFFRRLSRAVDRCVSRFARRAGAKRRILQLERQLEALAQDCRRAETRERERIACRLHDEVGQQIVLIRLKLGELAGAGRLAPERLLGELDLLAAQAAATTRALTFDLGASPADAGLLPALQGIARELSWRSGIAVSVDLPQAAIDLPEPQRSVACRTVREFCFNVQKHARARRVSIASQVEAGCLRVEVRDDGDGLGRPAPRTWQARPDGGFGLASAQSQLRALGGDLHLCSQPGHGTCARLLLPLIPA